MKLLEEVRAGCIKLISPMPVLKQFCTKGFSSPAMRFWAIFMFETHANELQRVLDSSRSQIERQKIRPFQRRTFI